MPTPNFVPPHKAPLTVRSIIAPYQDLLIHSAWQGDHLVWLGLGWAKDGPNKVQERASRVFPQFNFASTSDAGETARIVESWRTNRLTDLPMTLYGTPFQHRVWQELLNLQPLEHPTYGQIASRINNPKANRAVGSAVGANPITLIVPCHRILPQSGGVGNYGWGAPMKSYLLDLEQSIYASRKAA